MIRHGNVIQGLGGWVVSLAIESLTIAMVKPALATLLVAAVCLPPLFASALLAASLTAVSVTSVAVRADEEQRPAFLSPTKPPQQDEITSIGHRSVSGGRQPISGMAR